MAHKKLPAVYVDMRLPGRTAQIIRRWGERIGLSVEGMARLLLLKAVHEMLPSEEVLAEEQAPTPEDEGAASLTLWRSRLESIGIHSDQLPGPRDVNGTTRIYHADDFTWPEGATPSFPFGHIDKDGNIGCSRAA